MKEILIIIFVITLTFSVGATTYYLDATGGDNDAIGTSEATAWQNIWKVNNQNLEPGDVVLFKRGETWNDMLEIAEGGNSSDNITFGTYGSGVDPIITSDDWLGIEISEVDYIEIHNLSITGASHEGVRMTNSSNVFFKGGKIYDNVNGNSYGLNFVGFVQNVTVENTVFKNQTNGVQTFELVNGSNFIFRNITMTNHSKYALEINADNEENITEVHIIDSHFKYNGIGLNTSSYREGNILLQRAHNSILEGNLIEEGQGWGVDIYVSDNVSVRYNLFINNNDTQSVPAGPGNGLEINAGRNNSVYNNVFYNNGEYGLYLNFADSGGTWPPSSGSIEIKNNLFFSNTLQDLRFDPSTGGGNLTITYSNNINESGNPGFMDVSESDFRLNSSSSAIDYGVDVNLTSDYIDNYVFHGSSVDAGAYEYLNITYSDFDGDTTNLSLVDSNNLTNFVLEKNNFGKINFSEGVNLSSGADINSYVNISSNRIDINSSALPSLNTSATLTLYNLSFSDPRILVDGEVCPSSICTEISYSGGNYTFNVTHFSVYTTEETPSEDTEDGSSSSSSSGSYPSFTVSEDELQEGYERQMYKNWKLNFIDKNNSHTLVIDSVGNIIKFSLYSEKQTFELAENESIRINLDSDNYYDLFVEIKEIRRSNVRLLLKKINEEIISDSTELGENNETNFVEKIVPEGVRESSLWIIYFVIFILLVVIVFVLWKKFGKN